MLSTPSAFALFDDNLSGEGDLLLQGLGETISCAKPEEVEPAFAAIESALRRGCWIAVSASYELGYALEPHFRSSAREYAQPLLTAWAFDRAHHLAHADTEREIARALGEMNEHQRLPGIAGVSREMEREAYCSAVERIRALIHAGDCYQVNLTFAVEGQMFGAPLALYDALRQSQPVRYGSFIRHPGGTLLSRSPELFVERTGDTLTCRPMKGTAPRHMPPASLSGSEKNRAENVMIVDLIRNDLGRLAPPGGVHVDSLFDLESYPSLWQMTSSISARPIEGKLLTILRALFPCGSITGAPKIRAMEIIQELETTPRGVYCGALGWIAPNGDFRLSVPIRTLEADPGGRFRFGLGSGIVADSDAAGEWDECLLKGRFLTELRPSFGLIETLRCEPEATSPYPLLDLHLERLGESARYFAFAIDLAGVRRALLALAATLHGNHRVRLELRPDGRTAITHGPLEPTLDPIPSVTLSSQRVSSTDPLMRHKTTARKLYDAELEQATQAGHFDVLFLNERDELAEGARSNVFVDGGDGILLTPPLQSGALNGVFRRKMLLEGKAREARLTLSALRAAHAVYVGNALRGLIAVQVRES